MIVYVHEFNTRRALKLKRKLLLIFKNFAVKPIIIMCTAAIVNLES